MEQKLKKNRKIILLSSFILILFLFHTTIVFSAAGKWVTSKGQADIYNSNKSQARDEALQDAYNKAIKKAIGVYIKSSTLMKNMKIIENKIQSRTKGYIDNYEVINEYTKNNIYYMKIKAKVSAKIRSKLENLGFILRSQAGNPRVVLLVKEENDGQKALFSVFGSKLRSTMKEVGFELVDQNTIKTIQKKESSKKILEGNYEAAVALGEDYGADIVIYGKTFTELLGKRDLSSSAMYSMKAYGDIKAVTTQDGRIIASVNDSVSSYAPAKKAAGNRALKKLTKKIEKKLVKKIIAGINETTGQKNVKLVVLSVENFSQLSNFENILKELRGTKSVELRSFSNGVAQYDLKLAYKTRRLAMRLSKISDFKIEINQLYANRLEIKFK